MGGGTQSSQASSIEKLTINRSHRRQTAQTINPVVYISVIDPLLPPSPRARHCHSHIPSTVLLLQSPGCWLPCWRTVFGSHQGRRNGSRVWICPRRCSDSGLAGSKLVTGRRRARSGGYSIQATRGSSRLIVVKHVH
jgi:hypothetical protein